MYDLHPHLDAEVEPGTNILLTGPPLAGKRALCLDLLASGTENGEGSIIVTTKDSGDRMLKQFAKRTGYEGRPVAVVDCVTKQQGDEVPERNRVKYASSPVDMTGIGIQLSEFLQAFYQDRNIAQNRVMLHSLTTLLMYSDLQTVFRFLHVFTGRVQSVDGLGVYCIDSSAHDEQTLNTLKQLFDGVVELDEEGVTSVRLADS
ncbi:RAD55 family ATPase [Halolamina salifodinae]|uniref:KaiC/GvpD/RAD55 family RecA-like ATPase n=1 Tax=Halolamina salifodinae TaxID=1202767 RepID=A0A8T4GWG0_9EURY|nr:recombinase RecA [Halolamina salifodinae]MBP1986790.1 KaiC/GvpD/RAD55 family RecA-like ATPase [Halolamina salifodinae]